MQRLEVSGAVRPLYGSLGVKGVNLNLTKYTEQSPSWENLIISASQQIRRCL